MSLNCVADESARVVLVSLSDLVLTVRFQIDQERGGCKRFSRFSLATPIRFLIAYEDPAGSVTKQPNKKLLIHLVIVVLLILVNISNNPLDTPLPPPLQVNECVPDP